MTSKREQADKIEATAYRCNIMNKLVKLAMGSNMLISEYTINEVILAKSKHNKICDCGKFN